MESLTVNQAAMTQQQQQQQQELFTQAVEVAMSWMHAVHERLQANDSTHGPLEALEARLRETKRIHQSQDEGLVKMDMALMAAESILQSGDENLRNLTQAKLKELKTLWDETCTYIIHCHSRIEWAWLHWNEYLKACEELDLWMMKQQRSQELTLELQLGVKEKLWQVDQQRVVVSDIHGTAPQLERLLNEAAALHSKTLDPSLDPHAQQRLQEAYNNIRDGAEERLSQLQKITEEHQLYQGSIHKFQSWLLSKTKDLAVLMEQEEPMEDKLQALQTLDVSIASEEKTLQHIEGLAEDIRVHTSPGGAELVVEEAEEIRLGWHRLRQGLCEAEEGLRLRLDSHTQYVSRCQGLREDLVRLRGLLQNLDQELLDLQESRDVTEKTEEQALANWRRCMEVKRTLAVEESQVEHLKSQLKELFRFSEDSRHLSDDVLAVVKEQQSVKCKATRMCTESESVLRNIFQDPLQVYTQWSHAVCRVLESSAEVTDFSHVAMLVQSVERLHRDSIQLQDRLKLVQMKEELLEPLFGPEKADALQCELGVAIKNRELLHAQLLQRRSRLEVLITRTKDFGDAHESILSKLTSLEDGLISGDVLQPDILAKKSQSDQFRAIEKELNVCDAQIMALESLVSSSPSNKAQFEKLCIEFEHFHQKVKAKVQESEDNIVAHEAFHDRLLNIQKWLMIMKQKLESFRDPSGEWNIEGRRPEVEVFVSLFSKYPIIKITQQKALEEFPAKELEMQHVEVQGLGVLERTSKEGQVHIVRDMKCLKESWLRLSNMSLFLQKLLSSSTEQRESDREGEMLGYGEGQLFSKGTLDKHPVYLKESGARWNQDEVDLSAEGVGMSSNDSANRSHHRSRGAVASLSTHASLEQGLRSSSSEEANRGEVNQSPMRRIALVYREESPETRSAPPDEHHRSRGAVASLSTHSSLEQGLRSSSSEEANRGEVNQSPMRRIGLVYREESAETRSAPPDEHTERQTVSRRREFEAWLSNQNALLSEILSRNQSSLGAKDLKTSQDSLTALRSGVDWGQQQFELVLQEGEGSSSASAQDDGLEDLRYRWMLYKSKLKDCGNIRQRSTAEKPAANQREADVTDRKQKAGSLLQRACRLALPLCLLFLALLLLLFLLPLMDEGSSCSVTNNYARSFNVMLRYQAPPPT